MVAIFAALLISHQSPTAPEKSTPDLAPIVGNHLPPVHATKPEKSSGETLSVTEIALNKHSLSLKNVVAVSAVTKANPNNTQPQR